MFLRIYLMLPKMIIHFSLVYTNLFKVDWKRVFFFQLVLINLDTSFLMEFDNVSANLHPPYILNSKIQTIFTILLKFYFHIITWGQGGNLQTQPLTTIQSPYEWAFTKKRLRKIPHFHFCYFFWQIFKVIKNINVSKILKTKCNILQISVRNLFDPLHLFQWSNFLCITCNILMNCDIIHCVILILSRTTCHIMARSVVPLMQV